MSLAYWQMHDMGGGSWAFMGVGMVIVWALIIWAVLYLLRGRAPSAHEVLDRRLAAGEISVDEHARLREALRPRVDHSRALR